MQPGYVLDAGYGLRRQSQGQGGGSGAPDPGKGEGVDGGTFAQHFIKVWRADHL